MILIMTNLVVMEALYSQKIHMIKTMPKQMPFMKLSINVWMKKGKSIEKRD